MASNSKVTGPIWPEFELILVFVPILVTCKYDEDPIKNEGAIVFSTLSPLYVNGKNLRRSRASNSKANSPIWPKIKIVRDFMPFLINCKLEEDPIKMKALLCSQHFFQALKGK